MNNLTKKQVVSMLSVFCLSACSAPAPDQGHSHEDGGAVHDNEAAQEATHEKNHEEHAASSTSDHKDHEEAPKADWTTIGDYKFKLEPEIQKTGEAHLDFYVHDMKDAHVVGLTGTFHITMPDGTKTTLPINEEKPYEHYHGKLLLTQFGEYQIVAQAELKGQKYNPRFSFTRKQP